MPNRAARRWFAREQAQRGALKDDVEANMARGKRKYLCDDCKVESMHHWIELNRAARMRCPACGSSRLELVTAEAKDEAANRQAVRVTGGTHSTTLPPDARNPRKKIT